MKIKPYIPDFKLAFEHFCIHAGGRAVLDELEKNLELTEWHMEPSRMTLNRFGNTSSSSLWYELAYSEAKGRIKKGDRTWQIAFGSGFKCNSAVWRALRTVDPAKEKNPWMDEIDEFPVHHILRVFEVRNPLFDSNSPTPVVAFLSVTSKVAASASTTQIFDIPFYFSSNEWHLLLEILAILSLILGNLIAVTQTSMKRMLAYSSIGQIGYVIIGIIVGDSNDGYDRLRSENQRIMR
ncbi:hypothetical protein LguiA_001454 [Lonicera macranthoides]